MRTISISQSDEQRADAEPISARLVAEILASHKVAADIRLKLSTTAKGTIERGLDIVIFDEDADLAKSACAIRDAFGLGCFWLTSEAYTGCSRKAPNVFWCPLGSASEDLRDRVDVSNFIHNAGSFEPATNLFPVDPNGPGGLSRSDALRLAAGSHI